MTSAALVRATDYEAVPIGLGAGDVAAGGTSTAAPAAVAPPYTIEIPSQVTLPAAAAMAFGSLLIGVAIGYAMSSDVDTLRAYKSARR